MKRKLQAIIMLLVAKHWTVGISQQPIKVVHQKDIGIVTSFNGLSLCSEEQIVNE